VGGCGGEGMAGETRMPPGAIGLPLVRARGVWGVLVETCGRKRMRGRSRGLASITTQAGGDGGWQPPRGGCWLARVRMRGHASMYPWAVPHRTGRPRVRMRGHASMYPWAVPHRTGRLAYARAGVSARHAPREEGCGGDCRKLDCIQARSPARRPTQGRGLLLTKEAADIRPTRTRDFSAGSPAR